MRNYEIFIYVLFSILLHNLKCKNICLERISTKTDTDRWCFVYHMVEPLYINVQLSTVPNIMNLDIVDAEIIRKYNIIFMRFGLW